MESSKPKSPLLMTWTLLSGDFEGNVKEIIENGNKRIQKWMEDLGITKESIEKNKKEGTPFEFDKSINKIVVGDDGWACPGLLANVTLPFYSEIRVNLPLDDKSRNEEFNVYSNCRVLIIANIKKPKKLANINTLNAPAGVGSLYIFDPEFEGFENCILKMIDGHGSIILCGTKISDVKDIDATNLKIHLPADIKDITINITGTPLESKLLRSYPNVIIDKDDLDKSISVIDLDCPARQGGTIERDCRIGNCAYAIRKNSARAAEEGCPKPHRLVRGVNGNWHWA